MWLGIAIIYPGYRGSSRSYDRDRQKAKKSEEYMSKEKQHACMGGCRASARVEGSSLQQEQRVKMYDVYRVYPRATEQVCWDMSKCLG